MCDATKGEISKIFNITDKIDTNFHKTSFEKTVEIIPVDSPESQIIRKVFGYLSAHDVLGYVPACGIISSMPSPMPAKINEMLKNMSQNGR